MRPATGAAGLIAEAVQRGTQLLVRQPIDPNRVWRGGEAELELLGVPAVELLSAVPQALEGAWEPVLLRASRRDHSNDSMCS
jgi:hypothetical protein